MAKYIKPTLTTKYHIDFGWWQQPRKNLRSYLLSHVCDDYKSLVENEEEPKTIDWVDPVSGQVFQIDALWQFLRTHCAERPDFVNSSLPLATAVFRLFIVNNNSPLSPVEIYQKLEKKDAKLILRTIGGKQVYDGIQPVRPLISR